VNAPSPLILASASPRRKECLSMLGLTFTVEPADVSEEILPKENPEEYVKRLACEKALKVAQIRPEAVVIGGDTVVLLDNDILGKPDSPEDAEDMLLRLSGRTHTVASGLAIVLPSGEVRSGVATTEVVFRSFKREVARAYVDTEEPFDKAGAYGIQGLGAVLVSEIRGDYYTVVGLPIYLLINLLEECGLEYWFGSIHEAGL